MGTRRKLAVAAATATAACVLIGGSSGEAKITALPNVNSQFRKGTDAMARAIAANRRQVVHGYFSIIPPGGRPAAISTTHMAGFPLQGKDYVILSTGDARAAHNKNNAPDFGRGDGGPFLRGARDVVMFRMDLRVPSNANCLSFRFKFLSEEFPEFVNSEFNDAFIAELDKSSWDATSNQDPTIVAPDDFAKDPNGRLISVNKAGAFTMSAANAKGTTYDGATPILRASTPVTRGRHTVYFSLFDQGDREYDSAVFLDNLTLDNRTPCQPGASSQ